MGYNNNQEDHWTIYSVINNTKDVSVGKILRKALAVRQLRLHFIFTLQKIFPTHYATARRQYQSSNGAVSICSAKILSRRSGASRRYSLTTRPIGPSSKHNGKPCLPCAGATYRAQS